MRNMIRVCAMIAIIGVPSAGWTQQVGVAAHLGTLGLGADVALGLQPKLGVRAGANVFPFDISIESSDVDYNLSLPSPQFMLLVDLYPLGGLRLSGGVMISAQDFELTGELTDAVEIGGTLYTPDQLGSLTGKLGTQSVSPYLGVGYGNPARGRLGFFFDLGLAFHGTPEVSAEASGPVASLPAFQQDLAREVEEIQNDVDGYKFYPVLSLGISFGLGG